ncbi:MAG TPA: archaeal proteasome endopeptidase complex subunit alpha [Acidobacteriota bacterium]|nr:archaeal proteasome endopeptidase complex subunit alpha [Acidobacteriota bacterium]
MQTLNHQMMGYDRAITMFSPDGRLLQVEYAKKTVKQGSTAIGMVAKDGVVFITDKRIVSKLIIPSSVEKIFQIDDHIMATSAGIISDARILIERSQVKAQQYFVQYDSQIDILDVVKDIANLKQYTTQSGGLRPFGISMIIAGVDVNGSTMYVTDPTGIYFQYKAVAIGEHDKEVEDILQVEYKESLTINDCIKVGIAALMKVVGDEFDVARVDAAYIKNDAKQFTRLTQEQVAAIQSELKKK